MPFNGMTPYMSGSSLSAQARYAAGTLEILQSYFGGTPIREEYLIVDGGVLAGTGARSYKLTSSETLGVTLPSCVDERQPNAGNRRFA
jgi:formate dehydrogenase